MSPVTIDDEDDAGREVVEDGLGDLADDRVLDVVVADGLAVEAQLGRRVLGVLHAGPPGQR